MVSKGTVESKKVTDLIEVGKKFALLIGINEYTDSVISRLNFSINDIQRFNEILIDPNKGKFDLNNVKVLSDIDDEKPTRNNILSKLTNISRVANSEDSILFYFSGHGYEKNEKSYLLCSDSYMNTLEETAIASDLIGKIMKDSLARIKIIVLDACHSGAIKGIKDSGVMTKIFFETFFPPPQGFITLTSCKLGESSYEWSEKEHGVFSYFLLEGLRGGADRDRDGIITITDAYKYTSENVRRWAFMRGLEQNPFLEARIAGDIPFVFVEKALEKEEPIDKSIIELIILDTEVSRRDPRVLAEQMCGSLLQFFEANEIGIAAGDYNFPFGVISPNLIGEKGFVEISFEYKKDNWDIIDKIINYFGSNYYLDTIKFRITKRINMTKLVRKCKENAFEIVSFKPTKEKESITARTDAWLDTAAVFKNEGSFSEIQISRPTYVGRFPDAFYSTLSPENVMGFLKDCFE